MKYVCRFFLELVRKKVNVLGFRPSVTIFGPIQQLQNWNLLMFRLIADHYRAKLISKLNWNFSKGFMTTIWKYLVISQFWTYVLRVWFNNTDWWLRHVKPRHILTFRKTVWGTRTKRSLFFKSMIVISKKDCCISYCSLLA